MRHWSSKLVSLYASPGTNASSKIILLMILISVINVIFIMICHSILYLGILLKCVQIAGMKRLDHFPMLGFVIQHRLDTFYFLA